jgi:hypothetical protein
MYSKYNEIESLVEDMIENTILLAFEDCFSSKKECCVALEILLEKLSEVECDVFDNYYDN